MTSLARDRAAHFGPFQGDDGSIESLDALLTFAVNRKDVLDAQPLFETKWWDYRFVHPGHCFRKFHYDYAQALERWRHKYGVPWQKELRMGDHPVWRDEREWCRGSILKTGEKELQHPGFSTSLWRSMCMADAFGIPHDWWIEQAFTFGFEGSWTRLPSPNLLATSSIVQAVTERWEKVQAEITVTPKDPIYLADNYVDHPWQKAFQTWLVEAIARRPSPELALSHFLFKEPLLLPSLAEERFSTDVIRYAADLIESHC